MGVRGLRVGGSRCVRSGTAAAVCLLHQLSDFRGRAAKTQRGCLSERAERCASQSPRPLRKRAAQSVPQGAGERRGWPRFAWLGLSSTHAARPRTTSRPIKTSRNCTKRTKKPIRRGCSLPIGAGVALYYLHLPAHREERSEALNSAPPSASASWFLSASRAL